MDTIMHGNKMKHTRERPPYKKRRRVPREFPDPQADALGLSIHHVQSVVEYAHLTAGKCLEPRDGDIPHVACEGQNLAGCSSEAYNAIIFPLRTVLETLKKIEGGLESWVYKPRMMRYLKEELSRIKENEDLTELYRIGWIRNLLYDDIGRIDEIYVYSFTIFTNDIDPTICALQYLHDTLQIICTQLEIPIPILSPPADKASTSGTESETNSDPTPTPTSTKSSASGSTLTSSSSATIRRHSAPINEDATDEDETEIEIEIEDYEDEDEDEEMPDQPLHASFEIYTDNSSTNASPHGMDGASDTFISDLRAAARGDAPESSPAASIASPSANGASNAPNPSPSAPSTPSSHKTPPPSTPLSKTPRSQPQPSTPLPKTPRSQPPPSIGECIFPPTRKTYLPLPSDGYRTSSFSLPNPPSHSATYIPLPQPATPLARLYSLAYHITAQCLQRTKALRERGEGYKELAGEMGTVWEGWRGVVKRFEERGRVEERM